MWQRARAAREPTSTAAAFVAGPALPGEGSSRRHPVYRDCLRPSSDPAPTRLLIPSSEPHHTVLVRPRGRPVGGVGRWPATQGGACFLADAWRDALRRGTDA